MFLWWHEESLRAGAAGDAAGEVVERDSEGAGLRLRRLRMLAIEDGALDEPEPEEQAVQGLRPAVPDSSGEVVERDSEGAGLRLRRLRMLAIEDGALDEPEPEEAEARHQRAVVQAKWMAKARLRQAEGAEARHQHALMQAISKAAARLVLGPSVPDSSGEAAGLQPPEEDGVADPARSRAAVSPKASASGGGGGAPKASVPMLGPEGPLLTQRKRKRSETAAELLSSAPTAPPAARRCRRGGGTGPVMHHAM